MRKYIVLSVLALVFVSGCVQSSPVNCGSDEACFKENAANCTPATYAYDAADEGYSLSINAEIRGVQEARCVFYMKVSQADIPDDALSIFPELADIEGTEMTCRFPVDELMNDTDPDNVLNPLGDYCEGSYKDLMEQMIANMQENFGDLFDGDFEVEFG